MENEKLVELIQAGIDPRANMGELYKQNRGFLWQHTQRYAGLVEMDDILQECYFVLDKAVQSYDPSKGLFISWLGNCVKYYLPRQLSMLYDVKIPAYMMDMINRYKIFTAKRVYDTGQFPSDQEIMDGLDITESQLKSIHRIERVMAKESLYMPIGDEITLEDNIADDSDLYAKIEDSIDDETFSEILEDALSILTEKQSSVIRLRMQGKSLSEVGKLIDVKSRQAVQIREQTGLKNIRKYLMKKGTLQMLYEDAYRGTLASFNHTFTSTPEKLAIRHISEEVYSS